MSFTLSDLFRRIENVIRIGTIAELDHDKKRLRIQSGELLTDWLPWPASITNNYIHYKTLRINTQVIIASPSGDPAQALIIGQLYSTEIVPPSTGDDDTDAITELVHFDDGTIIEFWQKDDNDQAHLKIHSSQHLTVTCDGNATVNVGKKATITVGEDATATVGGKLTVTSSGDTTVDAPNIKLNSGNPIVTTAHICHFTGSPHGDGSSTCTAGE